MRLNTRDFFEDFANHTKGYVAEELMAELQNNLFIGETKDSVYCEWNPSVSFSKNVIGEEVSGQRYVTVIDKKSCTTASMGVFDILTQPLNNPNSNMMVLMKFYTFCLCGRMTKSGASSAINGFMHGSISENIINGATMTDILSVYDLTPDSVFALGEITPLYGKMEASSSAGIQQKKVTYEDLKSEYGNIFLEREFSGEEREMLQANADSVGEYYEPSPNVIELVKKVTKSFQRPTHLRKTNILLEGGTGTGKTKDSQVFADIIGLPYTKITCFSDMDSSDVTGGIYPVFDSKAPKLSDLAIEIDPEGCYMQLTGVQKDNVSPEEVRKILKDKKPTAPEYEYYASEIVKAFENGWVLEIQEPTCISDAAVLMILNSALEKDGVINLPDRTVRRHPDFICIMTTNRNYNGCRPLNEALRNRFDITRKVELPEEAVMVERLKKATGCEDDELLRVTVEGCNKLNRKIYDIGLNSCVSTRNMVAFIADIMDGFSKTDSVLEDFVWNITTDDEDAAELMTFLEQSTELLN